MKLYTQLNFGGNCEKAFRFYEKHLGGKIVMTTFLEPSFRKCAAPTCISPSIR